LDDHEEEIDFVSIGMIDFTMYALAVDRRGIRVAKHFNIMHPAANMFVILDRCNELVLKIVYVAIQHLT